MPATAENLRDLHALHQRAKALRDRLISAPKTLAARQQILATRTAAIEAASKAIKDLKAQQKTKETSAQAIKEKTSDLRVKLNAIKKQVEYDAIRNQIAHDNATLARLDDETLELMGKIEEQTAAMAVAAAEIKVVEAEVAKISGEIEARAVEQRAQLKELEVAIVEAEQIISEDQREQYRRNVKQRGADALASVEGGACTGCFVSVTPQMINELMNGGNLTFCKTCGRILYLAEEEVVTTKRGGR